MLRNVPLRDLLIMSALVNLKLWEKCFIDINDAFGNTCFIVCSRVKSDNPEVFFELCTSRGETGILPHLYNHFLGTQYPVTKVMSDDVTMMTS